MTGLLLFISFLLLLDSLRVENVVCGAMASFYLSCFDFRGSDSVSESESENEHGSEDNGDARKLNQKHNNSTNITDGN
ncbi:hypothetical protein Hanom_Chr06g00507811 [Helianthus anomalus]